MNFEIGDQVTDKAGDVGTVREVARHGVTIHWPKAFGWVRGHTVWYTHHEVEKWGIKLA